jgi:Carboxypeptidase regulatory-like domain/TonB dependent receptor
MELVVGLGAAIPCDGGPGSVRSSSVSWIGALILFVAAMTSMAFGQTYRGTINGTVTDSSGAAIVGAHVQVIDENTHFVSPATTNAAGLFTVPFLTPDTYDVKVEAAGFAAGEQIGVVLVATDIKQVNFQLKPAAASASVTVVANQELVQTESAATGQVLTPNEIQNSQYIMDNPLMLSTRVAGVYSNFASGDYTSNWRPVGGGVSGTAYDGLGGYQLVEVNGITDLAPEGNPSAAGYTAWLPPPGAVEELDVFTSPYDAEYGQTAGGVESVVIKDGTQRLHATASMTIGDTIFNANAYQRAGNVAGGVWTPLSRTTNDWREPTFTVTGPLRIPKLYHGRDRTYFMVGYEHATYNVPVAGPFVGSMPTARERQGDFSELLANPSATTGTSPVAGLIYDPATTTSAGARTSFITENMAAGSTPQAAGCAAVATTFNCIPTARINSVGSALMQYFPQPTGTGTSGPYVNNYNPANGVSDNEKYYTVVARVDHEFSDKNKLAATYFNSDVVIIQPNEGYPFVNGFTAGSGFTGTRIFEGGVLEDTYTISPTMVLNLRTGGQYAPFYQPRLGANFPLSSIGIKGATAAFPANGFPGVALSGPSGGYSGLQSGASIYDYSGLINSTAILSKSLQKHTLKFGFQYNKDRDSVQSTKSAISSGNFTFDTHLTNANPSNTNVSNGGDGVAALLLGYPSSGTATIISPPTYDWHYWGVFVQDDWRITSKLTLNLGLRYDFESPVTERHNYLNAGFDLISQNPMNQGAACSAASCTPPANGVPQGYHGGLDFVSASNRQPFVTERGDRWQPRIGGAYHIWQNTVVRGGFAMFLAPNPTLGSNVGFNQNTALAIPGNFYTPASCSAAQNGDAHGFCNMVNPYPNGFITPTGSSLGLSTSVGQAITYTDPQRDYPKSEQWSADVEQQLPFRMVLDAAYHGNSVWGLGITKNWNALPACYYLGGGCPGAGNASALSANVANPMAGYLPANSALNNATTPQSNLYLPYPEYGAINDVVTKAPTGQRVGGLIYNAMFVTLDKQASHGFEFRVNTTWAHVESRTNLLNPTDSVTSPIHIDANQPNFFFVGSVEYNVPKMNIGNHVLSEIANGWGITQSLNSMNGGFVLNPAGSLSTGVSPVAAHRTLEHWFNNCYIPVTSQVSNTNPAPVFGSPEHYQISSTGVGTLVQGCAAGESPAWIQQPNDSLNQISIQQGMAGVRAPWFPYYNVSFVKGFTVREGLTGQFRTDMYNPFNFDNMANGPSTSLTSSQFGATAYPYTELNDPRIIRFSARVSF